MTVRMHDNEISTDPALVRRLLAAQFPQWADLPITPVASAGTDNALYRLGDDRAVRLPRIDWAVDDVHKEQKWLPRLAPLLPLAIPTPLAMGKPGEGYPWHWSIYRWLEGENATIESLDDRCRTAIDLAQFITALQRIDITGAPLAGGGNSRGGPLATRDASTRESIATLASTRLEGPIDTEAALAVWEAALRAPCWNHAPVWFHGDLLSGNLLFDRGRLSAVIDFGSLGAGDPACDLMVAWDLFSGESRTVFLEALAVDTATWARARGLVVSQAVIFIPYYLKTNPIGVENARRRLETVIADFANDE